MHPFTPVGCKRVVLRYPRGGRLTMRPPGKEAMVFVAVMLDTFPETRWLAK
jgi:hypothetical protein